MRIEEIMTQVSDGYERDFPRAVELYESEVDALSEPEAEVARAFFGAGFAAGFMAALYGEKKDLHRGAAQAN